MKSMLKTEGWLDSDERVGRNGEYSEENRNSKAKKVCVPVTK